MVVAEMDKSRLRYFVSPARGHLPHLQFFSVDLVETTDFNAAVASSYLCKFDRAAGNPRDRGDLLQRSERRISHLKFGAKSGTPRQT